MMAPFKAAAKRVYRWLGPRPRLVLTLKRKNARWNAGPLLSIVVSSQNEGEDQMRLLDSLRKQSFRDFEILQIDDKLHSFRLVCDVQRKMDGRLVGGQDVEDWNVKVPRRSPRGRYVCTLQSWPALKATFVEKALFLLESYNLKAVCGAVAAKSGSRTPLILRRARLTASSGRTWYNGKKIVSGPLPGLICHTRVLRGALEDELSGKPVARSFSERVASEIVNSVTFRVEAPLINLTSRFGKSGRSILLAIPHAIIGGADAVLLRTVRHLKQLSFNVYVVATMAVPSELGDNSGKYESSTDAFYNLPEFLATKQEYGDFIHYLVEAKGIDTIFQVGSEVVYQLLPSLKERYPHIRVVDQLFNEVGHLANNRRFAEYIDCTIVTNETIKRILVEQYSEQEKKVKVIIHGVDTRGEFDPVRYAGEGANRPIISGEEFIVSYCGRISEEKGPDLFLEIARRLMDIPQIRFVMTGNGPLFPLISAKAAELGLTERFRMPGFVKDVRTCLIETNVVVVPSRIEGIPIILLEALSFGVPVVAARVGGIPSVITDGINGFVCAREDVQAFVDKIRLLHADRRLWERIARNSRTLAIEKLDIGRMLTEYASVFS